MLEKAVIGIIEQAMAKYDYILAKYGTTTYDNFIDRTVHPLGNNSINRVVVDNSGIVATISIVFALSLITVGGYFLLRKKKEER